MKYPDFIKKNQLIAVHAGSYPIGEKWPEYQRSLRYFKDYQIIEASSCKSLDLVSKEIRAQELADFYLNKDVKLIMAATGGDYQMEMLESFDFSLVENNLKWFCGYSDPTNIAFVITSKYDVATLYGFNAKSFTSDTLYPCYQNFFNIIKGNLIIQESFEKFESSKSWDSYDYNLDKDVRYESLKSKEIDLQGRLIGGCFDVICNLIGTKFDNVQKFSEKYAEDGLIWFFDVYSSSASDFYLRMLQMKFAGYFNNTKLVIIGRVLFKNDSSDQDFINLLKDKFDFEIIFNFDLGHTAQTMTFINGAMARVKYQNHQGSLEQWLD